MFPALSEGGIWREMNSCRVDEIEGHEIRKGTCNQALIGCHHDMLEVGAVLAYYVLPLNIISGRCRNA
jgi:hypothetical protein